MERHTRTFFKTLTWRVLATSATLLLVYFFTRSIVISASVSFMEIITKTIIYYLHERVWDTTNFGRDKSSIKAVVSKTLFLTQERQTKKEREWMKNE